MNRNDASTSARKKNARLCLCPRRPGSHMACACAYACACVVRVNQPLRTDCSRLNQTVPTEVIKGTRRSMRGMEGIRRNPLDQLAVTDLQVDQSHQLQGDDHGHILIHLRESRGGRHPQVTKTQLGRGVLLSASKGHCLIGSSILPHNRLSSE